MNQCIIKKDYLTVVVLAFCFALLFCGSSAVVVSSGTDSSVFYTVGRGMVQGKVAYRDLFDHKGLYLYLLNALGVLIADRHLLGLWLVETLFVLADCFLIFRIARQLGQPDRTALLTTLLALLLAAFYWEGGNLTETYGLLPELITFSVLLDVYGNEEAKPFPAGRMFVLGACVGVELFLRANMVMAWIPVAIIVIACELRDRRFRNAGFIVLYGLLGVLAAAVIPLLYCLKHGCLSDMIFASFLFNFLYLGDGPQLMESFRMTLRLCFFLLAFGLCASSTVVVLRRGKNWTGRWLFCSSLLFAVVSVLLSGRLFRHYDLYLIPFALPCLAWLASFMRTRLRFRWRMLLLAAAVMATVVVNSSFARDAVKRMLHYSGTDYSSRELVAARLEKDYPDVKDLLVVNGSAWYYVRLGVVPEERYFYLPSVSYAVFPDAVDAQASAVREGSADAVILEWQNMVHQIAMPEGARNEDVLSGLSQHYTEVFTSGNIGLYIRNDR